MADIPQAANNEWASKLRKMSGIAINPDPADVNMPLNEIHEQMESLRNTADINQKNIRKKVLGLCEQSGLRMSKCSFTGVFVAFRSSGEFAPIVYIKSTKAGTQDQYLVLRESGEINPVTPKFPETRKTKKLFPSRLYLSKSVFYEVPSQFTGEKEEPYIFAFLNTANEGPWGKMKAAQMESRNLFKTNLSLFCGPDTGA